jgi:DNA-binding transcriptional LysR family regulator
VQAFVAAGLGVAVIPALAVATTVPGVEVRQLHGAAPVRRISVAHQAGRFQSTAVRAMTEILQDVARRLDVGLTPAGRRPA